MGVFDFLGSAIKPVTDLIDNLSTSDEEKAELKNKLLEIENSYKAKVLEYESKVVESQKEIMVAELQQGDLYTKRARPTVLYAGLIILLVNHVLLPWLSYFRGMIVPSIDLPSEFWLAWGGVAGIYAFGRSREKLNNSKVDKLK